MKTEHGDAIRFMVDLFIIVFLLFLWCWDYPADHPAKKGILKISSPFLYFGLWHGWALFAPDPIHLNRWLRAAFRFDDGSAENRVLMKWKCVVVLASFVRISSQWRSPSDVRSSANLLSSTDKGVIAVLPTLEAAIRSERNIKGTRAMLGKLLESNPAHVVGAVSELRVAGQYLGSLERLSLNIHHVDGKLLTEFDVVTSTLAIEVKSGSNSLNADDFRIKLAAKIEAADNLGKQVAIALPQGEVLLPAIALVISQLKVMLIRY